MSAQSEMQKLFDEAARWVDLLYWLVAARAQRGTHVRARDDLQ